LKKIIKNENPKISDTATFMNFLWSAPLQIAISLYFLYEELSYAAFAILGVFLILAPISAFVTSKLRNLIGISMKKKDKRIKDRISKLQFLEIIIFLNISVDVKRKQFYFIENWIFVENSKMQQKFHFCQTILICDTNFEWNWKFWQKSKCSSNIQIIENQHQQTYLTRTSRTNIFLKSSIAFFIFVLNFNFWLTFRIERFSDFLDYLTFSVLVF